MSKGFYCSVTITLTLFFIVSLIFFYSSYKFLTKWFLVVTYDFSIYFPIICPISISWVHTFLFVVKCSVSRPSVIVTLLDCNIQRITLRHISFVVADTSWERFFGNRTFLEFQIEVQWFLYVLGLSPFTNVFLL